MLKIRFRYVFNNIAVYSVVALISSCASTSTFRTYEITNDNGTKSILIDAKQRAVIAVPLPTAAIADDSTEYPFRRVVVCAEPSPDALSTITASLDITVGTTIGGNSQGDSSLVTDLLETAQILGRRNATIQLLRDGLYRQCEAYLNGMITADTYRDLANRNVDAMVTLLAIERITSSAGMLRTTTDGSAGEYQTIRSSPPQMTGTDDRKAVDSNMALTIDSITRAFLNKNLIDQCLSGDDHSESSSAIDSLFTQIDALLLSNENLSKELLKLTEASSIEQQQYNRARDIKEMISSNNTTINMIGKTFIVPLIDLQKKTCDVILESLFNRKM